MQVNAGIAYDYFFKEHPRNFFGWLKLSAKGIQYWGSLTGPALKVSKNISRVAGLCQHGYDIPTAFLSFREVCEHYQGKGFSKKSTDKDPIWIDICRVVNGAVFLTSFSKDQIFDQPRSVLAETVEAVTDLVINGYGFYQFVCKWQQNPSEGSPVTISWDTQTIALLVQKVSSVALVGLTLISLSKGVDEFSPNLTILFTTASLSSHFIGFHSKAIARARTEWDENW